MVLVTYLNQLTSDGKDVDAASVEGVCLRLRPVLMTVATTALGLLPLLFSTGTGSEVQRPLATVVVGGLITSAVLTLLEIPALYKWYSHGRDQSVRCDRFVTTPRESLIREPVEHRRVRGFGVSQRKVGAGSHEDSVRSFACNCLKPNGTPGGIRTPDPQVRSLNGPLRNPNSYVIPGGNEREYAGIRARFGHSRGSNASRGRHPRLVVSQRRVGPPIPFSLTIPGAAADFL